MWEEILSDPDSFFHIYSGLRNRNKKSPAEFQA